MCLITIRTTNGQWIHKYIENKWTADGFQLVYWPMMFFFSPGALKNKTAFLFLANKFLQIPFIRPTCDCTTANSFNKTNLNLKKTFFLDIFWLIDTVNRFFSFWLTFHRKSFQFQISFFPAANHQERCSHIVLHIYFIQIVIGRNGYLHSQNVIFVVFSPVVWRECDLICFNF